MVSSLNFQVYVKPIETLNELNFKQKKDDFRNESPITWGIYKGS